MSTIHPMPALAPAPVFPSLWDVTTGIAYALSNKPRNATAEEVRAYLCTLALKRGVTIPDGATFSEAGIYDEGRGYIVEMPGYGAPTTVLLEELDEAGNVVRASTIGTTTKGALGIDQKAVREACALPKVRKARAVKVAPVAAPEPAQAIEPAAAAPEPVLMPETSALLARLEALEAIVSRLSRPVTAGKRQRSEAERAAILRAWRMRCEMRERADLDRRALMAANEANRMLSERLAQVTKDRDAAEAQAANARTAATDYRRDVLALDAERSAATARALRMSAAARRYRARTTRQALDLRGAQAEARALARRLEAAPARARIPAALMPRELVEAR